MLTNNASTLALESYSFRASVSAAEAAESRSETTVRAAIPAPLPARAALLATPARRVARGRPARAGRATVLAPQALAVPTTLLALPVQVARATAAARAARLRTPLVRTQSRWAAAGSVARTASFTGPRRASATTRRARPRSRRAVPRISAPKIANAPPSPMASARTSAPATPRGQARTSVPTAA